MNKWMKNAGCGELCSSCVGVLGALREAGKDEIVKRLALLTKESRLRAGQVETVVRFGRSPLRRGCPVAVSISSLRHPHYTGEFILLRDCDDEWVEGLRWALQRETEPLGPYAGVPAFRTECDVALQILQMCSDEELEAGIWSVIDIQRLDFWVGPPGIYNITAICEDDTKVRMAQSAAQVAMRALQKSFAGPPRAPPTRRLAAGDARVSRVQGGQALGHQRQVALGDSDPDASDSDHVHWADAQDAADVRRDAPICRRPQADGSYRARRNERLVEFDGIWFRKLVPGGGGNAVRGYSLQCPWHTDCVRDLSFGQGSRRMTAEECRRRLLAWAADGKDITRAQHRARAKSQLLVRYKNHFLG